MPDEIARRIETALAAMAESQAALVGSLKDNTDAITEQSKVIAGIVPEVKIHRVLILLLLAGAVGMAFK